jgi:hypothetical protein
LRSTATTVRSCAVRRRVPTAHAVSSGGCAQATRQLARKLEAKGGSLPPARRTEMYANCALVLVGLSLGGLGIFMSLKSAGGH